MQICMWNTQCGVWCMGKTKKAFLICLDVGKESSRLGSEAWEKGQGQVPEQRQNCSGGPRAGALSLGRLRDPWQTQWAFLAGLGTGLQKIQRRRFPESGDWNQVWSPQNQSWSAWYWSLDYSEESRVEYKETLTFLVTHVPQAVSAANGNRVRDDVTELIKNKVWLNFLNTVLLSLNFYWNIGDLQRCVSAVQHGE